jgi:hypothetical protein
VLTALMVLRAIGLIHAELLAFMRTHSLAVQTSVSAAASPQAAMVGIVVTDKLEVFFDTFGRHAKGAEPATERANRNRDWGARRW